MRIFVTGIAGFLGSHLADKLLSMGHNVYGNDNFLCGDIENIPCRDIGSALIAKEGDDTNDMSLDCCDFDYMLSAFEHVKPEVLIHCAATAHEGLSNFSPSFITRNIYEASVATFSAAIAAGVKRIVFMSSMARYGDGLSHYRLEEITDENNTRCFEHKFGPPFTEDQRTYPVDPYGIAKVAAEDTLKALCKLHNVEYVIAIPHNIIGPRQRYNDPYRNVASIMINRALQGKSIIVYGDGQQRRCFSPINDCLDSLIKMIDATIDGETINIGPDEDMITVLELAEMIRDLTGGTAEIEHVGERPNEVKEAYCSSDKARKLLGFSPKQGLRECLAEMVEHIHLNGTKEFEYSFPLEIEKGCPDTWKKQLI